MIKRTTRLRWRRRYRNRRTQVEDIGFQAEEHIDKHFFRRLTRLAEVRRFVATWLLLIILLAVGVLMQLRGLNGYYQHLQPVAGGTHTEGMVGTFTNASPLYATGLVDASVSRLVFAGLLKYDDNNRLIGDLAESWKSDNDAKVYTVLLRPNLKWHDGQPLTAADVVFTFQTIQNPDAKSPLFHAWQGIVVKAIDDRTVTFTLPNPLAPFIYSLTTGIVPKHSLQNIQPAQLRSAPFNTSRPIGAGPFIWQTVETRVDGTDNTQQQIGLKAFAGYHAGPTKLQQFVIKTYPNEDRLVDSFQKQEINALVGLDRMPDAVMQDHDVKDYSVPLAAQTVVFLRTDSEQLKDIKVRQALVEAVNVPVIISGLGYPTVLADEPLLRGQLGYNPAERQLPVDFKKAEQLLEEAGWKRPASGQVRTNGSSKLTIKFFAQNNADHAYLTQQIQRTWQALGAEVSVTLQAEADLQPVISVRGYDALLYGISIGPDPDVFAYWHSSQADLRAASRLNFSDYKSSNADKALEAGRSRTDPGLRVAKYAPFLQAWRNDAPALALYQPRFLYITRGDLFGFEPTRLNTATDRFNNVENWMVRQDLTVKP